MPRRHRCIEPGSGPLVPAPAGTDRLAEVRRQRRTRERHADLLALGALAALVLVVWLSLPPPA
jgi:predicted nucleic acid-binding Zn ribbon protein